MKYRRTIVLKDGRECLLRNAVYEDGEAVLEVFRQTHVETDYLLSYPDEIQFTVEEESAYLQKKTDSENEIEILALVDGKLVGTAGIGQVDGHFKTRHRAEFGVSVLKEYWGRGIGKALTEACIQCAENAGYKQVELEAVEENGAALALYGSVGFTEYGRNPRAFQSRISGWQPLVLMRRELNRGEK